jgi:radical SAM superfamily enzyme YgiQ (UPF0313 family)
MLGAYLRQRGHAVHLMLLGEDFYFTSSDVPDDLLHSPGGASAALHRSGTTYGFAKTVFHGNVNLSAPRGFLCYLQSWQPDIVGFSGRTALFRYCPEWFAAIRATVPDALLVAGGFAPSANPELYLDTGADIVVRGEGEEAITEVADCLDAKRSWAKVRNLSWKDGNLYRHNPLRPQIRDLDSLPMQLLNAPGIFHIKNDCLMEEDPLFSKGQSTFHFLSGRGCIGSCSYCASGNWRNMYMSQGLIAPKYRRRSIGHMLQELEIYKGHGQAEILIRDDFFIRPPQEMLEFLRRYKQEIGLPLYWINFPPAFIERHPEILDAAIDAGLRMVNIPIQSGDGELTARVFGRRNDYPQLLRLARLAMERYLVVHIDIIDGYIFDDRDDLDTKLDFIRRLPAFDPKFPYSIAIAVHYIRREEGTPLSLMWPELNARFFTGREFAYRALLMQLRYILDDEAFFALRANERYKADPRPLVPLNHALRRAKHNASVLEQAKRLAGQKVYFWGCGEIYQARKDFFFGCKPQAMLLDVESNLREVDGVKVYRAEDILGTAGGENLPIVIFSNEAHKIARKIKWLRPDYAPENIIACQTVS